jgi:hypothetical protein
MSSRRCTEPVLEPVRRDGQILIWEVNYAKQLEMNSFFPPYIILEVGKYYDLENRKYQTVENALRTPQNGQKIPIPFSYENGIHKYENEQDKSRKTRWIGTGFFPSFLSLEALFDWLEKRLMLMLMMICCERKILLFC